jgi:hypothetical protein
MLVRGVPARREHRQPACQAIVVGAESSLRLNAPARRVHQSRGAITGFLIIARWRCSAIAHAKSVELKQSAAAWVSLRAITAVRW